MLTVLEEILEERRKKRPAKARPQLKTINLKGGKSPRKDHAESLAVNPGVGDEGRPREETPVPRSRTVYDSDTRHHLDSSTCRISCPVGGGPEEPHHSSTSAILRPTWGPADIVQRHQLEQEMAQAQMGNKLERKYVLN